ncbi:Capn15, partial [Symbiodinium microadriaticum]
AGGYGFALVERRVKVRNPWGEWTRREQDELLAQLGAAVVPDEGSFWMNYGDFIRGFAVADICYARDGWHARSFDAEFGGSVGCRSALQLRGSGECWVMAIQPTDRGKQVKRPPGYYLNDLSLLIFQETQDEPSLVTAAIGGARRDVVSSVVLEAGKTYRVVPLSFRGSSSRGSFVLRLYSASPVQVREESPSPERTWAAFHRLLLSPEPPPRALRRAQDFGVGRLVVLEGPAMAVGLFVNFGPVGFLADLKAFGNHAALRTLQGIQEGTRDEHRNQQDAKRQPSDKKKAKADWRQHHLQVHVPGFAQLLAFVAVALLEKDWEFSLESLDAEQLLEDSMEKPPSSTHPFAPVSLEQRSGGSDGLELEDLELQAALRESARLAQLAPAGGREPDSARSSDSDPELQLALSMSLLDEAPKSETGKAGGCAPADEEPPPRRGRWMRRSRQT